MCPSDEFPDWKTIPVSLNVKTKHMHKEDRNHSANLKAVHAHGAEQAARRHSAFQLVGGHELSLQQLLVACLQAGQEELWAEFVRRSQPIIAGVIVKTIRCWGRPSADLIDDLVQETYMKLWRKDFNILRRFTPRHENALPGFLKVVASNTVRDYFRMAFNWKRGRGVIEIGLDCAAELRVPQPQVEAFDRILLLKEIYNNLLKVCSSNPNSRRDQMIFLLYYKYGLTAESISRLHSVGLSIKGVESTILRMVRLVKLSMGNQRNGPSRLVSVSDSAPNGL
ncbi:MAG TPA: sigma-70 family RNA polymerase sigma factor [Candidatus Angelobacter sp.]